MQRRIGGQAAVGDECQILDSLWLESLRLDADGVTARGKTGSQIEAIAVRLDCSCKLCFLVDNPNGRVRY